MDVQWQMVTISWSICGFARSSGRGGVAPTMKCKLLVVGAPRSGTRYTARLLQSLGAKVRHENFGVEGCVSSLLTAEDFYYPFHKPIQMEDGTIRIPRRSEIEWEHILHQVREPLGCISSLCYRGGPDMFWRWQEKHSAVNGDMYPVERRAMRFWVQWNYMAECISEATYRVEDMATVFPELLRPALGMSEEVEAPHVERQIAPHGDIHRYTWDELMKIDSSAARTCQFYARRWGYKTR